MVKENKEATQQKDRESKGGASYIVNAWSSQYLGTLMEKSCFHCIQGKGFVRS